MTGSSSPRLNVGLPKGRMQEGIFSLLAEAGIRVRTDPRGYRPTIGLPGADAKILKPQNLIEMLHMGSRDIGFAGADWVAELKAEVVELLDTGLDPVRLVAAAPASILEEGRLPGRPLVVASEYERITRRWIADQGLDARFVRSYGATEVFPPEDADLIVDNTSSGATLHANGLVIVDELMRSSTRLLASPRSLDDPSKREAIDRLVLLVSSVLSARKRVMLEVNVPRDRLSSIAALLPCMRNPTISELHGGQGYAVKAAVPRDALPSLIPEIKRQGGSDIVVTAIHQIVA